jgi:hypothetical protein
MQVEYRLLGAFATRSVDRVVRQTIHDLRKITNARLSGDDSGLANAWEEICVQLQLQESIYWDSYDATARSILTQYLERLPPLELEAIWLRTDAGFDWLWEHGEAETPTPVCLDDALEKVTEALYGRATDCSDPTIPRSL